jgi:hypothetical protein
VQQRTGNTGSLPVQGTPPEAMSRMVCVALLAASGTWNDIAVK